MEPTTPPPNDPVLAGIASKVAKGQCILFLGAGVHATPPAGSPYEYSAAVAPPRGGDLAQLLAVASNYEQAFPNKDPRNLQRVAAHYEHLLGRQRLVADIRQAVSAGKRPSAAVEALARLPFPVVITTNYDRLYEQALTNVDREFEHGVYEPSSSVPTNDLENDPDGDHRYVLKIHGDVQEPQSLVVTEEDYIDFIIRMGDPEAFNPIPLALKVALKRWPTLFIGYSLTDYNLRLLYKTLRCRIDRARFPLPWSVDPYPDPLLVRIMGEGAGRQVSFIATDVWNFVPALYQLVTGTTMPPASWQPQPAAGAQPAEGRP